MRRLVYGTMLLCLLLVGSYASAQTNTTINPLPATVQDSQSYSRIRTMLQKEDAARQAELYPFGVVISGGTHTTAGGMVSAAFATTAYTDLGNRVVQASATIDYNAIGCAANDTAWVAISSKTSTPLGTYSRVAGTQYYVDCVSGTSEPALPTDMAKLMRVDIVSSAIADVHDLRTISIPTGQTHVVFVHNYATGGTGSAGDPWTGWEGAFSKNFGMHFIFAPGHFRSSTALWLKEPSPDNPHIGGSVTIEGAGRGVTYIHWEPDSGTTGTSLSSLGLGDLKTWLTIGVVGSDPSTYLIDVDVVIRNFTLKSADGSCSGGVCDTGHKKRGIHWIDCRICTIEDVRIDGWHDSTNSSVGLHIEGRGQNIHRHLFITGTDYPLVIDGTPNEGGACYAADPGWTGSPGTCEYDTSTFEDISLEVTRGYFDGYPWVANPNIFVGASTALTRNNFRQINFNGGSYGFYFHLNHSFPMGHNNFENIPWEGPSPLDPTDIGAGRLAASVDPSTMIVGDPYGDNAALEPHAAWGYMFDIDASAVPYVITNMTFRHITSHNGGNMFRLHGIIAVEMDQINYLADGYSCTLCGKHYPGQLDGSDTPSAANKAVILDIDGLRTSGTPRTSYPVTCMHCQAAYHNQNLISTDLDIIFSTPVDPVAYNGTGKENIFPSSALVMWDSVKDTNPGAVVGISSWTPRLTDDALNEPSGGYASQVGVVIVQQIGTKKLVTFYGSIVLTATGTTGMTGTDTASIRHTNGNNWGTADTTSDVAVNIGLWGGITLSAGYTQLSGRIPLNDQRIVLQQSKTATAVGGASNVLLNMLGADARVDFSGFFVIQE